jgi:putative transposase
MMRPRGSAARIIAIESAKYFGNFNGGRRSVVAAEIVADRHPSHSDSIVDFFLPRRKRPAHFPPFDQFNRSTIILLTVCADRRRPLLARSEAVAQIVEAWRASTAWQVGRYVILPDHLHAFCWPSSPDAAPLRSWVRHWKSAVSRRWPWAAEQPIWQQDFWDRQLRTADHYSLRWDYVRQNAVRHELVTRAEDWPWQGELNEFQFHDPA